MSPIKYHYRIGIDPGRNTGLALYKTETRSLVALRTVKIHEAFRQVLDLAMQFNVEVVIENPNLWTHFHKTKNAKAKLQGAGSVKRDFSAWQDFLKDHGIPYRTARPDKTRNSFAVDNKLFTSLTGYTERCSEHARVAAMLVWR